MYMAGDGYYYKCADHTGCDYRQPLVGYKTETVHHPYSGRNEKETEIVNKQIRATLHTVKAQQTKLERGGKEQHPHYARRERQAGEPHERLP